MDATIRNNNSKENLPDGRIHPNSKLLHHRSPKPQEGDLFRRIPGWKSAPWKAISHRSSMVLGPDFWWFYHPAHETRKDFRQPHLQGKNPWIGPVFLFRVQFYPIKNIIWKWSFLRINHMLLYIKGVFWVGFTSILAVFRTQIIPQPFKARIPATPTGDPGENPLVPWLNKSDDCPIDPSPEEAVTDETRYIGRCPDTHRQ